MGSEACASLVGSVLPDCLRLASKHAEYASSAKENVDKASDGLAYLKAKRATFENEVKSKAKENKIPSPMAQHWLKEVDTVDAKVGEIKKRYVQRGCRATEDCPLNLCLIYGVSKEAARLREKIEELKAEKSDQFFEDAPQSPAKERPIWPPLRAMRSLQRHLDEVRSHLDSDIVGIVGIWGLEGVGKTTLLTLINNSMLGAGNSGFEHVVWAQASRDRTLESLQNAIISELRLPDQTDDKSSRDARIFKYLNGKNFLLLVDDMFEQINLTALGVPIPGRFASGRKHKVVFTTRSRSVCSGMMANRAIKLDFLGTDEAHRLFREVVTDETIDSEPQIPSLANQVVDLCGGLPSALVVIGQALSDKRTHRQWEHVIQLINDHQFDYGLSRMKESVFETLKLSYDSLKSDKLQRCFLCCCLWPRGHRIPLDDLIECWVGLGLIREFDWIHDAYNEGYSIVGDLEGEGLLASDLASYARLHGVLWFFARWIASDRERNTTEWALCNNVDQWTSARRESPMNREAVLVKRIPENSNLAMKLNTDHIVPSKFVEQIVGLKYLDLSFTKVEHIPEDIEFLLELEYLNLSHTRICLLPTHLRRLKKLKYLLLRCIEKLQEESMHAISQLAQLQVLDVSPYVEIAGDALREIGKHVRALSMAANDGTVLDVMYGSISVQLWSIRINETGGRDTLFLDRLSKRQQHFLRKLEFHSCIGLRYLVVLSGGNDFSKLEELCIRHLESLTEITWEGVSPPLYFPVLQTLVVEGCRRLKNITWIRNLPCLRKLRVADCGGMEEVICDADGKIVSITESALRRLEELILKNLPRLRSVYNQPLTLKFLESVEVVGCPMLRRLPLSSQTAEKNKFEKIEGERAWLEGLVWENDDTKSKFARYYRELKASTA
ncbi:probable disease resistance protein At1g61300 [Ananas comosus]|uniref:Probable disease resistance protein At1g61300 n=1 Tax=Ananas comosus TaxID=4615 RepID=A0A6P5FXW1_ANACO|nr:probable disease resistance protein At1g61300 [Ananas comosus]